MKIKHQHEILDKLKIASLNSMQEEALKVIPATANTILLSPTGTGKSLAFLLPVVESLDEHSTEVQALILVPSRELAIQIEQVVREMGSGYKANAVYGGRAFSKDKLELSHPPAILIGTPGRVADHLRRETFSTQSLKTLVLDEFDKSLEIGFENEMSEIIENLPRIEKRILTSATHQSRIPGFTGIKDPVFINYLQVGKPELLIKRILSPTKDKLQTLGKLLLYLEDQSGIVFCNLKDSIQEVSTFLSRKGIEHTSFHGGMEQKDRERALIKFRNASSRVLLATDLAARGIDISELDYVIHYELPLKSEEFTHRNGRTARMNQGGSAYVLQWEKEDLPSFIPSDTSLEDFTTTPENQPSSKIQWQTLFISGGRKDKISKGDIAGLLIKKGNLQQDEIGLIELKNDCAFVAVPASSLNNIVQNLNNIRLKTKKVRIFKV